MRQGKNSIPHRSRQPVPAYQAGFGKKGGGTGRQISRLIYGGLALSGILLVGSLSAQTARQKFHSDYFFADNRTLAEVWESFPRLPVIYRKVFYPDSVSESPRIREFYRLAVRDYQRDLYYNALGYLERAWVREPGNAKIWSFAGRVYSLLGLRVKALAAHKRAFENDRFLPESLSYLANYQYRAGNYPRAAEFYRLHVSQNHLLRPELYRCMVAAGRTDDSLLRRKCRERLLNYQPRTLDKWNQPEGRTWPENLRDLNSYDALEAAIKKFWPDISVVGANRLQFNAYTTATSNRKKQSEAIRSLLNLSRKQMYFEPENKDIYRRLEHLFHQFGRPKLLTRLLEDKIGILPDNEPAYSKLGDTLLAQKKYRQALVIYRRWIQRRLSQDGFSGFQESAIFFRLGRAYRLYGHARRSKTSYQLGQLLEDLAALPPGPDRQKKKFHKLLAYYRLHPRNIEVCEILRAAARERKNEYMAANLDKRIQKEVFRLKLFP